MIDISKLDPQIWVASYTKSLGVWERVAYIHINILLANGRDYVSLRQMAQRTGLRYDQCETFLAKFHADRAIPRMTIVEEMEG